MIADPLSHMVVLPMDGDLPNVALTTKSLVFGEDISFRLNDPHAPAVDSSANCALLTWSHCDLSPASGSDSLCCTMVFSTLPAADMDDLVSSTSELPLSTSPVVDIHQRLLGEEDHTERGNVHTFLDPSYSAKDCAKLNSLPYVHSFLSSRALPEDPVLARWTQWLTKHFT